MLNANAKLVPVGLSMGFGFGLVRIISVDLGDRGGVTESGTPELRGEEFTRRRPFRLPSRRSKLKRGIGRCRGEDRRKDRGFSVERGLHDIGDVR